MTDLRKAAEMALEVMEYNRSKGTPNMGAAIEALRQALAQLERGNSSPNYPISESITTFVDAVNMSQECVDETAKREHEPVAWFIQYEHRHEFLWRKPNELEQKTALEIKPLYTAPPKREWVGLTKEDMPVGDNPIFDTDEFAFGAAWAQAKLKEKNT